MRSHPSEASGEYLSQPRELKSIHTSKPTYEDEIAQRKYLLSAEGITTIPEFCEKEKLSDHEEYVRPFIHLSAL